MRKKHIAIFLCIAVSIFSMLMLTACGSLYDEYKKVISDWRDVILEGESSGYQVTVISGIREQNFALDGTSGDKIEYTLFTILPSTDTGEIALDVTIGEAAYSELLNKHPLGSTYSVEIAARHNGEPLTMSVNGVEITVQSVTPDIRITGENALEIAKGTLDFASADEMYVRLIENPVISDGCYYWYVAVYSSGSTKAVLIDISSGEILAERK